MSVHVCCVHVYRLVCILLMENKHESVYLRVRQLCLHVRMFVCLHIFFCDFGGACVYVLVCVDMCV